jgi:site-specific DNA-cytosine methylase
MMNTADFVPRISEIKKFRTRPNMVLLCGGFAPEVVAYKRLGAAPLGTVILQDTDLHAVGVAVAAHPDVEFALVTNENAKYPPGDIRNMRTEKVIREVEIKLGGVDTMSITNPCQSFSLAGKTEGFCSENGQLLHDSLAILRGLETSSSLPTYLAENVPSTKDVNESFNAYLGKGAQYFLACGSICAPCIRKRRFATNRPPPICSPSGTDSSTSPPSLNGDLPRYLAKAVVEDMGGRTNRRNQNIRRMVHPKLKKFPCLMNSNPKRHAIIWEQRGDREKPINKPLTPMEAELAMGYGPEEVGVTEYSAYEAVKKRIEQHDYERDGCLISLKGCGDDKDSFEKVDDTRRLELLGNSQVVTLLEALIWNERFMFPAVNKND